MKPRLSCSIFWYWGVFWDARFFFFFLLVIVVKPGLFQAGDSEMTVTLSYRQVCLTFLTSISWGKEPIPSLCSCNDLQRGIPIIVYTWAFTTCRALQPLNKTVHFYFTRESDAKPGNPGFQKIGLKRSQLLPTILNLPDYFLFHPQKLSKTPKTVCVDKGIDSIRN